MKKMTKTQMEKMIADLKKQVNTLTEQKAANEPKPVTKLKRDDMFVNIEYECAQGAQDIWGTLVNAAIEANGNRYFYLEGEDGLIRKFNKAKVSGNCLPDLEEKVGKLMKVREAVNAQKHAEYVEDLFAK